MSAAMNADSSIRNSPLDGCEQEGMPPCKSPTSVDISYPSEISLLFLLLHRRRLVVVDHAALPLRRPRQQHFTDDGRQGIGVRFDRARQGITAQGAEA